MRRARNFHRSLFVRNNDLGYVTYNGRVSMCVQTAIRPLPIHPSGDPAAAKPGGEAQACGAHGEITDQIPHQADELYNGGQKGQQGAAELLQGLA